MTYENKTYDGTLIDHVLAKSSGQQTPSVCLKFATDELPDEPVYWYGWLSDAAIDNTIKALREAFGWAGTDIREWNGTEKFVGQRAKVVVKNEEYPVGSGKWKPKVQFVNHINGRGGGLHPMDDREAETLAGSIQERIMAYAEAHPMVNDEARPAFTPPAKTANAPAREGEIPF